MTEPVYTDQEIIAGIRSSDESTIRWMYRTLFPEVKKFVTGYRGSVQDAHDVFQDALLILYQRISGHFDPKGDIQAYLFGICRIIWYKRYDDRNTTKTEDVESFMDLAEENPDPEGTTIAKEELKRAVFLRNFQKLAEICRKILKLFFQGIGYPKMHEIVPEYSLSYLPKKKQKCLKKLIRQIREDPEFTE